MAMHLEEEEEEEERGVSHTWCTANLPPCVPSATTSGQKEEEEAPRRSLIK